MSSTDFSLFKKERTFSEKEERRQMLYSRTWGPLGLAALSITTQLDSTKYHMQELIRRPVADTFRTHVDDWIMYGPLVMMYGADLLKLKSKNTPFNQTKYLLISYGISTGIMLGMKYAFGIERPDGSSNTSYPSGHTTQAFVQAQVFFNEFRDNYPVFASTGYLFAATTGSLRILNNRHWAPDVLLGAGLAMLVTNLVYHFEPLKDWNPYQKWREKRNKKKKSEMMFIPTFGTDNFSFKFQLSL